MVCVVSVLCACVRPLSSVEMCWCVCCSEVVWGGKDAIQNAVRRWCDDHDVALLLTAGGEARP